MLVPTATATATATLVTGVLLLMLVTGGGTDLLMASGEDEALVTWTTATSSVCFTLFIMRAALGVVDAVTVGGGTAVC